MPDRRELHRSPNGNTWFLGREPTSGHASIIHQPNAPSGGRLSPIELGEFLRSGNGPEQQALLREEFQKTRKGRNVRPQKFAGAGRLIARRPKCRARRSICSVDSTACPVSGSSKS
jgi:hypothetical protein